jgi:RNA polymerase sigma-70 factor (ECF subfamily)
MLMHATDTMDRTHSLPWQSVLDFVDAMFAMSADESLPRQASVGADTHDVALALSGDHEAFARLIGRHQAAIGDQMRRFSRDAGTVEELVHEVFVEAFVSLKSYRSHAPFLHWLRKIAVRTGYRFWTRKKRERSQAVPLTAVMEEVERLGPTLEPAPSEASQMLGELLEHLSPRDRLVLTLLYWDGCTVAEAAELAGWSQTMVKVQAYRARNRLKKLIEETEK